MTDTATINFSCTCGGKLQTKDDVRTDASRVTCASCGTDMGTYGELIAEGNRRVVAHMKEIVDADFAKLKKEFERPRGAIRFKIG